MTLNIPERLLLYNSKNQLIMKKSTFKYLVIEDDKSIWKNISARMSEIPQWKPIPFTDSLQEAISLIDAHHPDLIFSDWSIRGGQRLSYLIPYTPNQRIYTLYHILYRLPRGKP